MFPSSRALRNRVRRNESNNAEWAPVNFRSLLKARICPTQWRLALRLCDRKPFAAGPRHAKLSQRTLMQQILGFGTH